MATRIYGANPGFVLENVTEGVGSATASKNVELTVDLASTIVNDAGVTRTISKNEVLIILELFQQYIIRGIWPPA